MLIGYMRVSTGSQDLALQRDALLVAGVDAGAIYSDEGISGTKRERAGLEAALTALRASPGSTLVVYSLSRLSRSLPDLLALLETISAHGGTFRSLTEDVRTDTATGRLVAHVLSALSAFEADLLRERTLAGLASARARGRIGGKRPIDKAKAAALLKLIDGGMSPSEAAKVMGLSRALAYRLVKERRDRALAEAAAVD